MSMLENLQRWVAIIETSSDKRAETLVAEMRDAIEEMRASGSQPKLIYLATPYTSKESVSFRKADHEQSRFEHACIIAARLFREGYHVYSPIAASHGIAIHGKLGGDWQTWKSYDERMISLCDELWVATEMPGWDQSVGVAAEIAFARSIGNPVVFYEGK